VIPYPSELYQILELRMPQHLSRHRVLPRVFYDALRLAVFVFLDTDNSFGEAFLELLLVFPGDWTAEDDVGEKAVGGGGYGCVRRCRWSQGSS
jgi:hypothetical protein